MPLLAALLGSAFSSVVAWLTSFVGKRLAIAVSVGGFLAAGWIAFQSAIRVIYEGVAFVLPGWMVEPMSVVAYLIPSNFSACLSAVLAATYARFLWDRQREWVKVMGAV